MATPVRDQITSAAANSAPIPGASAQTRGTRLTLGVGFGGLLLIMTLAGIDALRVSDQIRREDDQIRQQFLFRNQLLNEIRSQVYLSGTYVRDYLLEPEPKRASGFRESLESVRRDMGTALTTYAKQLSSADRGPYQALTDELAAYWHVLDPIFSWDPQQRKERGYPFLRDEVFPRRSAMLDIAGRIADLNEQQLNEGNRRLDLLWRQFQERVGIVLLAAFALGVGMAWFSIRKILGLEASAQARFEEVAEARQQLTALSASLVKAQETERRALSRELHDEVGQALSAVLVGLRNLTIGIEARSVQQTRADADSICRQVESAIRVVRNMALLLRPSMLDDLGLLPALRWQAREVSKQSAMNVSVVADVPDDLPDEYKTCIYRVVQEALHNCTRHSRASNVRIRVEQKKHTLRLTIQDDGIGFDVKQSKGLGILGMEERVSALNGSFSVRSGAGRGTLISVDLPFRATEAEGSKVESETDSHTLSG